jgi:23S rRNA pseudouridine955/2504/2580 synthase
MTDPESGSADSVRFLTVEADVAGQRIDNFLMSRLKGAPRTLVYRILRTGEVRVNKGRIKAEYRVQAGDVIRVPPLRLAEAAPPPQPGAGLMRELGARIVYEDHGLLVLNKPAGLAVHGGSGVSYGAIEALRVLRPDKHFMELVHRLDRGTSGMLMIAEKRSLLRFLHEELRQGRMHKVYVALLSGRLKDNEYEVRAPLRKDVMATGEHIVRVTRDGKEAHTDFKVIERVGNTKIGEATLVEATLHTGRTHQIRVHAQFLGHPIVGDEKYGNDELNRQMKERAGIGRLFLHARDLRISLPDEPVPLSLHCPLDADLQAGLERLRRERV